MRAAEPMTRPRARAARVVLCVALVVVGSLGAYWLARSSSLFAVERIDVRGASPAVERRVQARLQRYVGTSLVSLDTGNLQRLLVTVPEVSGARFDRAFPHTLRVDVSLERPVAIVRRGSQAWLVSTSGRVLRPLARPYPQLPRVWVSRETSVDVNATIGGEAASAVRALIPLHDAFPVRTVRASDRELTLVLAGSRELRLGNAASLRLKLAIAKRLLPLTKGATYVDVSVPERPVAAYPNPQVAG
jgi:cell division protein FtsQ